jgi:hypothetical protein
LARIYRGVATAFVLDTVDAAQEPGSPRLAAARS